MLLQIQVQLAMEILEHQAAAPYDWVQGFLKHHLRGRCSRSAEVHNKARGTFHTWPSISWAVHTWLTAELGSLVCPRWEPTCLCRRKNPGREQQATLLWSCRWLGLPLTKLLWVPVTVSILSLSTKTSIWKERENQSYGGGLEGRPKRPCCKKKQNNNFGR